jgi:beta-glucanase (GH16 family)
VTQSFQVAPFDIFWRPNSDFLQIPNYNTTQMNGYCGGPFQQAISGTTLLNNNWYDGKQYQKYAFEYEPGTSNGKIAWFVGEDRSFMMDGHAIGPNGNVNSRIVSEEPMSMVLNLGISTTWGEVDMVNLKFPTIMRVDYVRIYQREGQEHITCDPPGFPTTDYIAKHLVAYTNPNLTVCHSSYTRSLEQTEIERGD